MLAVLARQFNPLSLSKAGYQIGLTSLLLLAGAGSVHDATALGIDADTLRTWFAAEVGQLSPVAVGESAAGPGKEGDRDADGHTHIPGGHDQRRG